MPAPRSSTPSCGNIRKRSVAIVAIKILASEIIHHVEVRPAVAVVIIPAAAETVARVVLVEPRFSGDVSECSIALVAHHEIRGTVFCVVIGQRIFVLVCALIVAVEAEINVQPTVAVVVGKGGAREGSLRGVEK